MGILKKTPAPNWEQGFSLSLYEVSASFGVSTDTVMNIIEEGIISVQRDVNDEWQFNTEAVHCIRIVLQLERDLGVNLAGAALVLELLKEVDRLHVLLEKK